MSTAIQTDGAGGYTLSRGAVWLFGIISPTVAAALGILGAGYVGDAIRDRDVAEVRLNVAGLVAENAGQIRDLIDRWQAEHDTIVGLAAQGGELGRRGDARWAARDGQMTGVDRRLSALESSIAEIRTQFAGINVRLDILLGRDGRPQRDGQQQLEQQPVRPG